MDQLERAQRDQLERIKRINHQRVSKILANERAVEEMEHKLRDAEMNYSFGIDIELTGGQTRRLSWGSTKSSDNIYCFHTYRHKDNIFSDPIKLLDCYPEVIEQMIPHFPRFLDELEAKLKQEVTP